MNLQHHSEPHMLERYSFLWSEIRLIIAAVALFLGGVPVLVAVFDSGGGIIRLVLTLCWIISGLASGYLLYRFLNARQTVFGHKSGMDVLAFLVSVVSGLNLGIVGLTGRNIGMSIASSKVIFIITGLVYLAAAYHLYRRWKESGEKVF